MLRDAALGHVSCIGCGRRRKTFGGNVRNAVQRIESDVSKNTGL